jgi:hypothetical protein
VVKSSPWSADCGGVPESIVIVPPVLPPLAGAAADDVEDADDEDAADEDELDELPHAATANAMIRATAAHSGLVYFLIQSSS